MYSFEDLATKLEVSTKTVQRYVKNLGIKSAGKDGNKLLFDDKALTTLRDALDTKNRKHESVTKASMANVQKADTPPEVSVKIYDLLQELDKTGRSLASDEYLNSIAERVCDMLDHRDDVNEVVSLLTNAINRAKLLDDQHDDLLLEIRQLDKKVDHLYEKLVGNLRNFNYKKMAEINAQTFLQIADKKDSKDK